MPLVFTPTQRAFVPQAPVDPYDLAGEDIALVRGNLVVSSSGDWQTVADVSAAKQSIEREAAANPGSFARRASWGIGLSAAILKNITRSMRDELTSRARLRLRANPRVTRLINVAVTPLENTQGVAMDIACEVGGRDARINTTIKAGE